MDVNLDGHMDLVLTQSDYTNPSLVTIFLGHGDATFDPPSTFPVGVGTSTLLLEDLNGDGMTDLIATTPAQVSPPDTRVLLARGDGTFEATAHIVSSLASGSVALDDVDGDGRPDLLIGDNFAEQIDVRLGRGNGTFGMPMSYTVPGAHLFMLAVADMNGDNVADLIYTDYNRIGWAPGNGDGTFQAAQVVDPGSGMPSRTLLVTDINGDGHRDVAFGDDYNFDHGGNDYTSHLRFVLGHGDGTFEPGVSLAMATNLRLLTNLRVADLDGDGRPEIMLGGSPSDSTPVAINVFPSAVCTN